MAASDVTVSQDGDQSNIKLHPYLVTLLRWCVSCIWSAATVLLHRFMTAPLPSIGWKPKSQAKPRAPGKDHLDPEPKVDCVVLHEPTSRTMDVIFVHGLYGSLGNTWRQGEWMSKYKIAPIKVPIKTHLSPTECNCQQTDNESGNEKDIEEEYVDNYNETMLRDINEQLKKILPNENVLITEKFYKDKLDMETNYQTQGEFVSDLFKNETKRCENESKYVVNADEKYDDQNECKCKVNERKCEVGCGCVCDQCYSNCWPKDWIPADFPGARVISINYTSDPYLWRPLWIKENKRLRLHERAEQMMEQLLQLGVGDRPIIWVGHSKGGLFIKQIYCEAYEAHLKLFKTKEQTENIGIDLKDKVNDISNAIDDDDFSEVKDLNKNIVIRDENEVSSNSEEDCVEYRIARLWHQSSGFMLYSVPHRGSPLADIKTPITARSVELMEICEDCPLVAELHARWLAAVRGSARGLVRTCVRSVVETRRTLMSLLWLRIVSVQSADAGIGTLSGVCVDHREICKPTSRRCLLYTELSGLIRAVVDRCRCQS